MVWYWPLRGVESIFWSFHRVDLRDNQSLEIYFDRTCRSDHWSRLIHGSSHGVCLVDLLPSTKFLIDVGTWCSTGHKRRVYQQSRCRSSNCRRRSNEHLRRNDQSSHQKRSPQSSRVMFVSLSLSLSLSLTTNSGDFSRLLPSFRASARWKIHRYEIGRRHLTRTHHGWRSREFRQGENRRKKKSTRRSVIDLVRLDLWDAFNYLLPSGLLDECVQPRIHMKELLQSTSNLVVSSRHWKIFIRKRKVRLSFSRPFLTINLLPLVVQSDEPGRPHLTACITLPNTTFST